MDTVEGELRVRSSLNKVGGRKLQMTVVNTGSSTGFMIVSTFLLTTENGNSSTLRLPPLCWIIYSHDVQSYLVYVRTSFTTPS